MRFEIVKYIINIRFVHLLTGFGVDLRVRVRICVYLQKQLIKWNRNLFGIVFVFRLFYNDFKMIDRRDIYKNINENLLYNEIVNNNFSNINDCT